MTSDMKTIVCLANSRRLGGRCIAGRELLADRQFGGWIRVVSARENEEVSEYEREYEDGSDPSVLDIIRVPLLSHKPSHHQRENWLLDPEYYWKKEGAFQVNELDKLVEPASDLWTLGASTDNGLNDKINYSSAARLTTSLRLIAVPKLVISVYAPGMHFGNRRRRVQAQFLHNGKEYRLWITDPTYERRYKRKDDGNYDLGSCYLTVSLGESYKSFCYSLVATVIEKEPAS